MPLRALPRELVDLILLELSPRDQTHLACTCKFYQYCFKQLVAGHKANHEAFSEVGWYDTWHAIRTFKLEYVENIWKSDENHPAADIPSFEDFMQLGDVPEAWLVPPFNLESDLKNRRFSPVLAYFLSKTPNLRSLAFTQHDEAKYLINVLPRISCQLRSIDIDGGGFNSVSGVDFKLVHILLSIPTLHKLSVRNIYPGSGYEYDFAAASSRWRHDSSQVQELSVHAMKFPQRAVRSVFSRLPKLQHLDFTVDAENPPGRFILQQAAQYCPSIETLHIGDRNFYSSSVMIEDRDLIEWSRFQTLKSLSTLWEDVLPWEKLPTTLTHLSLRSWDVAESDTILSIVPSILTQLPNLIHLRLDEKMLLPKISD